MKNVIKHIAFTGLCTMALMLSSCTGQDIPDVDSMLTKLDSTVSKKPVECEVRKLYTSNDYKYMDITMKLGRSTGGLELSDTAAVRVGISQKAGLSRGVMMDDSRPPILLGIRNVAKEQIAASPVKMLMLVDLSLPQSLVDSQLEDVRQARTLLNANQLYVAFMQGDQVSETYEATDYILDNYFKHQNAQFTYLYRSVLTKLQEMTDSTSVFSDAVHKGLIVLTNGKTYNEDRPIDPRHFDMQQRLAEIVPLLQQQYLSVYYSLVAEQPSTSVPAPSTSANVLARQGASGSQQELGMLRLLVSQTTGLAQNSFEWPALRDDFMKDHQMDFDDYQISLMMPDNKVFRGNHMELNLDFFNRRTNEKVTTCKVDYSFGSVFYPIIIGGKSLPEIIMRGYLVTICLLMGIWLTLQIVVPWIRYRIFLRRHVVRYTGSQMSKDGIMLAESCYLCKAPFEVGDEIVTKCEHVMHKDCWDENGYQCPEHGRNCRHGSHYYNFHNLLDHNNATFYMDWILGGILAGLLAWMFFMWRMHLDSTPLVTKIVFFVFGIKEGTLEAEQFLLNYSVHLDFQPSFGFCISFFTTFVLSMLSLRHVKWRKRIVNMFLRAVIAGILGYQSFATGCMLAIMMDIKTNSLLLDCLPWILMTIVIMYCVTWHTRVRIRLLWFIIACFLGLFSMYIWMLFYQDTLVDFRLFVLLSFLFTSTVIAVCIAFEAPKSEHYFLQVRGAIKPLEIALYKWLRADPSAVVTLGQSVDCSIQLSWDIAGDVAPVHAEIFQRRGVVCLKALEKGVLLGDNPLQEGDSEPLSHGVTFTIGNTFFTYVEKDY